MIASGVREQIAGVGFAAGWEVLGQRPRADHEPLVPGGSAAATARGGPAVRQLRMNLGRVVGPGRTDEQMDALVRDAMRCYARYWLETFRLPKMDRPAVAARVGQPDLRDRASGRGGARPAAGSSWLSPYRQLRRRGSLAHRPLPPAVHHGGRAARGLSLRPLRRLPAEHRDGGARADRSRATPTAVYREQLKASGGVCLVADRDLSQHGVEVNFFGEQARMPSGPALLAATTETLALLPVGLWFTPDGGWGQRIIGAGRAFRGPVARPGARRHPATRGAFAQLISAAHRATGACCRNSG